MFSRKFLILFGAVNRKGYGRLIREARLALHMSQEDLARRMNTSASTISNLEREQHPPTVPDQVNALCDILPITREQLLMAMDVRLRPSPGARLPQSLMDVLTQLRPGELHVVELTARGQLALRAEEEAQSR